MPNFYIKEGAFGSLRGEGTGEADAARRGVGGGGVEGETIQMKNKKIHNTWSKVPGSPRFRLSQNYFLNVFIARKCHSLFCSAFFHN